MCRLGKRFCESARSREWKPTRFHDSGMGEWDTIRLRPTSEKFSTSQIGDLVGHYCPKFPVLKSLYTSMAGKSECAKCWARFYCRDSWMYRSTWDIPVLTLKAGQFLFNCFEVKDRKLSIKDTSAKDWDTSSSIVRHPSIRSLPASPKTPSLKNWDIFPSTRLVSTSLAPPPICP